MKAIIMALILVAPTATAQDKLVTCQRFGTVDGEIRQFKNHCPLGWYKI